MSNKISDFLVAKVSLYQASAEELSKQWGELDHLYTRRLWHELTVKLLGFVNDESFSQGGLLELYENLIKDIEDRIKPESLVTLVQCVIGEITDVKDAIAFLEPIKEKVKHNVLAISSLNTTIAELRMGLGELDEAKKLLAECEETLHAVNGVTSTHADYYRVAAQLKQIQSDHAGFYTDALRFLGCVDKDALSDEEKAMRAFDLGLAALLGKDIYNVGELLAHDIINALKDTDKQWLVDLLYAFNSGDVGKFKGMKGGLKAQSPDLDQNVALLNEKFSLLSVMEIVFQRGTANRRVDFKTIAAAAEIPENEVELLVMKALSKKLVKGTINQIDQIVDFTWVQPRVLDITQLASMQARLGDWLLAVGKASDLITTGAPELIESQ